MCGIAGLLQREARATGEVGQRATAMATRIAHRGPDAASVWTDGEPDGLSTIALAHRRLSILDLSQAGQQPMVSAGGRYIIVYNGEIYNHLELRQRLGSNEAQWRGHSDTETLLAAIEAWGLEQALRETIGMFAFALWDKRERALFLARDRFGEKPLYYGWQGDCFLFASEIKSFEAHPNFRKELNTEVLGDYFRYGNVPGDKAIWKGLNKLPPASWTKMRATEPERELEIRTYWRRPRRIDTLGMPDRPQTIEEAEAQFENLFSQAVDQQMISDVPIGAFLSGGVDSSLVVSELCAQSSQAVKTFTIGFEDQDYDESGYAESVARHLNTEHRTLRLDPAAAQALVPRLVEIYDEPFADISAIPTILVSRLAKESVSVVLTGDGADELFAGYSQYHNWKAHASALLCRVSPRIVRMGLAAKGRLERDCVDNDQLFLQAYESSMSQWPQPPVHVASALTPPIRVEAKADAIETMMRRDIARYMPDDILVKVDRAAMSTSLETRAPFLDHRIAEFAASLPNAMLAQKSAGKHLLKRVLYRRVPRRLVDRPKKGFGIPVDHWLRGPLREWGENLLSVPSLESSGLLQVRPIRELWQQHLAGTHNHRDPLWVALMFQAWFQKNVSQ